ncbi:MAG: T9SS type A sorting domain-containing protein [bacterium]
MKTTILFFLFVSFVLTKSSSSNTPELTIINKSNETVKFVTYPIGAIFNGNYEYDLECKVFSANYDYIFGGQKSGITLNQEFKLDQDGAPLANGEASIGYGKYRIVFYKLNSGYDSVNYCDVNFSDADYPYTGDPYLIKDLTLEYYSSTNIKYYFGGGAVSIPGSKLIVSWDQRTSGNTNAYKTQNKNGFISSSSYPNWPLNATDLGAVNHAYLNEVYVNLFLRDNGVNLISNKNLTFKNSNFTIKDTTTFTFNSGSTLSMDAGSRFRTFQTYGLKTITVGNNVLIDMKDNSSLNLKKTKFELASGATDWRGITLTNTLLDTLYGCEFNGTDTCVSLYNSDKCGARTKKYIVENTFNGGVVFLRNIFQCLINNNIFELGSQYRGLIISNSVHPNDFLFCAEEIDPPANTFNLNIVKNEFSGGSPYGCVQLHINCLASDLTPFFISDNEFVLANGYPAFGIATAKASGDIKNNIFTANQYDYGIRMYESEINLLHNVVNSSMWNLEVLESSSAVLAPLYSNNQDYWYGGKNDLQVELENISFDNGSEIFLNYGFNCLTTDVDHISGLFPIGSSICERESFPAVNNYWSPFPPISSITCNGIGDLPLRYDYYNEDCITEPEDIVDYELIDRGDGILDTILITEEQEGQGGGYSNKSRRDISSNGREDEELLTQALLHKNRKQYDDAISKLKNLIDNYDSSRFINKAVGELYITYSMKDTGVIQSNTTSMFNSLEDYLEEKIEQYESNSSFLQKAYSYYLMCLTKTLDYNEAILGYENIIENHPDTVRRLLASWDRSANVLLQQGSGGSENLTHKEKLEKLFKDKPIHALVKNSFKKMTSSDISNESKTLRQERNSIANRVTRFNPDNRDELDSKISKDLELLLGLKFDTDINEQNIIPTQIRLYQNYPNPFNPVTSISYELAHNDFVEIKVYDVAGKELMSLVNSYKDAGKHSVTFNGTNLSSGIYFYKLKAGEFEMVRKMMLIK